jgi:hypothetical protein
MSPIVMLALFLTGCAVTYGGIWVGKNIGRREGYTEGREEAFDGYRHLHRAEAFDEAWFMVAEIARADIEAGVVHPGLVRVDWVLEANNAMRGSE